MIDKCAELLQVKADTLQWFDAVDPFNHLNLTGWICRESNENYGSMVITSVEDEKCEQIIYGTPKLEYPFDRAGTFHFPTTKQLEIYDKLDGTNVLGFQYEYFGQKYRTYKTRLSPILKDGRFGGFFSLWSEYLQDNDWILQTCLQNPDYNLSFEMFGSRNPITIHYTVPLEVNLLFGIRSIDQSTKPPSQLSLPAGCKIPTRFQAEQKDDLIGFYESLRAEMSQCNQEVLTREGTVLYAFCQHSVAWRWKLFKCKPDEICKIHWAAGGIPHTDLWNTAVNSFEEGESTLEHFYCLLREEYTEQQIGRVEQRIKKTFYEAKTHMELVAQANMIWSKAKSQGLDVTKDKNATFRFISQHFDKNTMRKVAGIILKQAGMV